MAQYFLHVKTESFIRDYEGGEWSDLESARAEAVAGLRAIMAGRILSGIMPEKEQIIITDMSDRHLETITITDAILKEIVVFA